MAKAALAFATLIVGLVLALSATAQPTAQQLAAGSASVRTARPLWSELSPKQQAVLAPIAAEWDNLDTTRRKKWVAVANRYPKMKPDQQQRLQDRMQHWASLSPAQRRVAREKYRSLKQLPRTERGEIKQRWRQQTTAPAPNVPSEAAAPDVPDK